MNYVRRLIANGMTNCDQGLTIQDVTSRVTSAIGTCTAYTKSIETEKNGKVKRHLTVCGFRTTDVDKDMCPACGHALYWQAKNDTRDL